MQSLLRCGLEQWSHTWYIAPLTAAPTTDLLLICSFVSHRFRTSSAFFSSKEKRPKSLPADLRARNPPPKAT